LSIWFAQIVAREIRVIDYHEAFGNDTDIDTVAQVVKSKPYMYDMHYLPHDGKHERMGMKGSISDQLRKAGLPNRILPQVGIAGGIEKGKALIKSAWIDKDKTKNGLHAMMHYRYEYDEGRQCFRDNPHDDWACDASDAWRYLAIALDQKPLPDKQYTSVTRPLTWSPF